MQTAARPKPILVVLPTSEADLAQKWNTFQKLYPTVLDRTEAILKIAEDEDMFRCPRCRSKKIRRAYGKRIGSCENCKSRVYLTAGTFFDHIKRPDAWMAAIWLLEEGLTITPARFTRLVGIAISSALSMFKKLMSAVQANMGEKVLSARSALFVDLFCKRSQETPARCHPSAEEEAIDREALSQQQVDISGSEEQFAEQVGASSSSAEVRSDEVLDADRSGAPDGQSVGAPPESEVTTVNSLTENQKEVYDCLSEDPIDFETLLQRTNMSSSQLSIALLTLEFAGLVVAQGFDCYARPPSQQQTTSDGLTDEQKERIAEIHCFVRCCFHGISRKAFLHYLAAFWCRVDRVRWAATALLRACWHYGPITGYEACGMVTPPVVAILPIA